MYKSYTPTPHFKIWKDCKGIFQANESLGSIQTLRGPDLGLLIPSTFLLMKVVDFRKTEKSLTLRSNSGIVQPFIWKVPLYCKDPQEYLEDC